MTARRYLSDWPARRAAKRNRPDAIVQIAANAAVALAKMWARYEGDGLLIRGDDDSPLAVEIV